MPLVLPGVLLALIVGAALLLPAIVDRTVPFGVRVPPERADAEPVAAERRRYRVLVLLACGGAAAAALAASAVTGQAGVMSLGALVVIGAWLLVYARSHLAVAAAKEREGWYAGLRQGLAADTELRTAPERFPWPWSVPALLVLGATVVTGIVRYPHLPATLPTHYGANGAPNAFAATSVPVAFGLVLAQAVITAATIGVAWAWLRARGDLDPRRPEAGARQHRARVAGLSRGVLVLAACVNASFFLVSWTRWQGGTHASLPVLAVTLLPVAGVAALLAVALRTVPDRRRAAAPAPAAGDLVPVDDDRFWVGGLLCWNPEDPSLLVQRRFGVGLTPNLGNVRSWLLLAAFAGLLALPLVLRWR